MTGEVALAAATMVTAIWGAAMRKRQRRTAPTGEPEPGIGGGAGGSMAASLCLQLKQAGWPLPVSE